MHARPRKDRFSFGKQGWFYPRKSPANGAFIVARSGGARIEPWRCAGLWFLFGDSIHLVLVTRRVRLAIASETAHHAPDVCITCHCWKKALRRKPSRTPASSPACRLGRSRCSTTCRWRPGSLFCINQRANSWSFCPSPEVRLGQVRRSAARLAPDH